MKYIISLTMLSCAPAFDDYICHTSCGLVARKMDDRYHFGCNQYETALAIIASKRPDVCKTLSGYTSWERSGRSTAMAAGWTQCEFSRIDFHNLDGKFYADSDSVNATIADTAFTHEVYHAIQWCFSLPPIDDGQDSQHSDWVRNGFNVEIDQINNEIREVLR